MIIYCSLRSFLHYNTPPIPYVNSTARTAALLPQTALLIRSAVKMFLRPLHIRYNEPDTHKAMPLYIMSLRGPHLFY